MGQERREKKEEDWSTRRKKARTSKNVAVCEKKKRNIAHVELHSDGERLFEYFVSFGRAHTFFFSVPKW